MESNKLGMVRVDKHDIMYIYIGRLDGEGASGDLRCPFPTGWFSFRPTEQAPCNIIMNRIRREWIGMEWHILNDLPPFNYRHSPPTYTFTAPPLIIVFVHRNSLVVQLFVRLFLFITIVIILEYSWDNDDDDRSDIIMKTIKLWFVLWPMSMSTIY